MPKPLITIGDRTSHGGTVLEGSPFSDTGGKAISRIGDKVSCPNPKHRNVTIVSGDATMLVDGKPAARQGDNTSCGATLIPQQAFTTVG